METKCIGGLSHTAMVSADDPEFDPSFVSVIDVAGDVQAHPGQFGYCSRCYTAMRFDTDAQRWSDLPQANCTPHCDFCQASIGMGAHYITDVHLDIDTFRHPKTAVTYHEVYTPPVRESAVFCGPLCVMYMLLEEERLRDVFGR